MRIPKSNAGHWKSDRHKKYFGNLFHATPPWLSKEQCREMRNIWKRARSLRQQGRNVQADHIVPVVSKYVCGLNVPWNYQIIEAGSNMSKGNRYWPDCPWENLDMFNNEPQQLTLGF